MRIRKVDDELQIVYGEVYAPGIPDSQGDFMTADTIRKMAHNFLSAQRTANIDTNHDHNVIQASVVESFISRKGDTDFPIEGSWVAGVHVEDPSVWAKIKNGDYNGFSLDGLAKSSPREIEIEIPEHVTGRTDEVSSHAHVFKVSFDDEGNLVGGETDFVQGHSHKISRGTVTDETDGHSHRFSFIEVLLNAT